MTHDSARRDLAEKLVVAIKAFQDSVDRFDAAAAAQLGVNETDLRSLAYLASAGPTRPSRLADVLGLTRGATTTALGRLAEGGFIERSDDATDARSHFVRLSAQASRALDEIWSPIRSRGAAHLAGYSDAQLRLLTTFMERSIRLHDSCGDNLDAGGLSSRDDAPPS